MGEEEEKKEGVPERPAAGRLWSGRALEMGRARRHKSREPFPRHVGSSLSPSESLPWFSFRTNQGNTNRL